MQFVTTLISPAANLEDGIALVLGVSPSMCSALTSDLRNSSRIWIECADAAGEDDGRPALSDLIPVRDNVAHELVVVHTALKLPDRIVARLGFNAAQIRIDRRID